MFFEIGSICLTLQKPQQFVDDTLKVNLLGSNQWEALLQIKAQLATKNTHCTGASAICFTVAM
jgi:hypothetical protein